MSSEKYRVYNLPQLFPKRKHKAMGEDLKDGDGTSKSKKYGFRLTPEEQELAYELKAGMMRKLETQNAQLKTEINMQKRMRDKIKEDKRLCSPQKYENMTQSNAVKLVKLYERKNKEGSDRVEKLETALAEATQLAKRYRRLYQDERAARRAGGASSPAPDSDRSSRDLDSSRLSEGDLEDDEALFKRHIARLADMKSMLATTPIRVQDIIRKNEVILNDNDTLRREVTRLKEDNAHLILHTKHAKADKDKLLHMIAASESNRRDLTKRLDKEHKQYRVLHSSLTRQATDWVQARKEDQAREDFSRWMNVNRVDVLGAEDRTHCHPAKKSVYLPRKMYPVEQYSKGQATR